MYVCIYVEISRRPGELTFGAALIDNKRRATVTNCHAHHTHL